MLRWIGVIVISVCISLAGCKAPAEAKQKPSPQPASKSQFAQPQQPVADLKEIEAMGKDYINLFVKGDFATAASKFTGATPETMPTKSLQELWAAILARHGQFIEQVSAKPERVKNSNIVLVTCKFEKELVDIKVVYNDKKEVTSISFPPRPQPGTSEPKGVK